MTEGGGGARGEGETGDYCGGGSVFMSFVLRRYMQKGIRDGSGGAGAGSFRFLFQQGSSELQRGRVTGFS
jgi:hypothetical protein